MRYSDCNIDSRRLHCSIVRSSMDRPPSYSEACSAPPLYETPFNKISMLEAPPVYPETSKEKDIQYYEFHEILFSPHSPKDRTWIIEWT
ncbi:huntingtin-interacting protein K [Apis cerana cerana]|uniref:Huntingtin-interacting protein K n=1 Tax=Apis cerana cerana TaxID=94128 RepID=A0A2A3EGB9_APICC|nr:huntingtin-interacting protein K [Apis cerana cerana]